MVELKGNIFSASKFRNNTEAICVTTNGMIRNDGHAVMGAGIAKTFRDRYTGIDLKLAAHLRTYGNIPANLGSYEGCLVFSFPTKHDWRDNSDLKLIEDSAIRIRQMADELNLKYIYLPKVGCANGHLDWMTVKPVLEKHFDDRFVVVDLNI